jgi:hypothetical protein
MAWWDKLVGSGSKQEDFDQNVFKNEPSAELGGFNVESAIQDHIKLKQRLHAIIEGNSSEKLYAQIVSMDNQCPLGKWLYAEGERQFGSHPYFQKVVKSHGHYHLSAGNTLWLVQDGKLAEAKHELSTGNFARISLHLTSQLMHLWMDIKAK